MPLRQEYYYEEDFETVYSKLNEKVKIKSDTKVKPKVKKKTNSKVILGVVLFALSLTLVYRFAVINTLNLEVIKLRNELDEINTLNTQLKFGAESNVNLSEIERYATDELGMQKLQNYQIEYIKLDKQDLLESEKIVEEKNIFQKIVQEIIEFFN